MPIQNIPAALASSIDAAWLCLLTITDASGGDPLRVVDNTVAVVSRGNTFEPYPFQVMLPADDSEQLPKVTLNISNLDAAIVEYIRESILAPKIAVELVTSQYPDQVEVSLTFLTLTGVTYDAMTVSGQLDVDTFLTGKFPAEAYTPVQFPALFR